MIPERSLSDVETEIEVAGEAALAETDC